MAIGTAVASGNLVRVYDENGRLLTTHSGELHGFTSSTVSIRSGNLIRVYDERGRLMTTHSC